MFKSLGNKGTAGFTSPDILFNEKRMRLVYLFKELENKSNIIIKNNKLRLVKNVSRLDSLSPLKTLVRGYSIVEDKNGNIIKSAKQLNKSDEINVF